MRLDLPGAECAHPDAFLALAGASQNVGYYCTACELFVTQAVAAVQWLPKTHRAMTGVVREVLPRISFGEPVDCEICQKRTATPELHHWLPRALYREIDVPGEGPQAWLCPDCHATWHEIVTPMLVGGVTYEASIRMLQRWYKRWSPQEWRAFVKSVTDADAAVQLRRRPKAPPPTNPPSEGAA